MFCLLIEVLNETHIFHFFFHFKYLSGMFIIVGRGVNQPKTKSYPNRFKAYMGNGLKQE